MELIHQTSYAKYYYDPRQSLLIQEWDNSNGTMTDDDYKHDMNNYLKFVREYDIKRALINLLKFNYTIVPEIQQWVDEQITKPAVEIVRSIAFVLPQDLFVQVSVKQVMREKNANYEHIEFFNNQDEAIAWLEQH